MELYKSVTVQRLKWRYRLTIVILIFSIIWLFKVPLLKSLARMLEMPPTTQTVDALIVEGGQTVSEIKMTASLNMVQANQARKIVISLNTMEESATFAVRNYAALLAAKLDSIGLSERQYFIIHIAVGDPFTYNTARKLSDLIGNDVRSIGIVQDNFHIRRSYLTYKKAFAKKNVTVYPCTFFIYADMNNWWKSLGGIRRIFGEYVKLAFYFYHGYI